MLNKFSKLFFSSHKQFEKNGVRYLHKHVAIVLSGSGVFDGTEITEAVSCMIHLSRHNVNISFFAPNTQQLHVVNHAVGQLETENRNVMHEAARISRGSIQPLSNLNAVDFSALVVPGGFGAAKNLSDFAINGTKLTVNADLQRVIKEFAAELKPMGFCCIAPVLLAKVLPGCTITVGQKANANNDWPYAGTIDSCIELGAKTEEKDVNEISIDANYNIVTTPAFMKNASFFQVFSGIGFMIDELLKRCK